MRTAVLGSGTVGRALVDAGHSVTMGSRRPDNAEAQAWAAEVGATATDFTGAVQDAELVVNALPGLVAREVLVPLAGDLEGVTVLDVSNPLDFSGGFPPLVRHDGGMSLGERLQAVLPHSALVKGLNTVTAAVMVQPSLVPGEHHLFICGDDTAAKAQVVEVLQSFGWTPAQILDLGDITAARGTESYLALWVRLMGTLGTPVFNVAVVRGDAGA
jgi:8-hydroxy-5-deazaflavin:NADPH oxidoreductase